MEPTSSIALVGAGATGTGIAQACVLAGLAVTLLDVDEPRVARGLAALTDALAHPRDTGRLTDDALNAARGRLFGTTRLHSLDHCHFIIEAATEAAAPKARLLRQLEEAARDAPILATNISSVPIAPLAAAMCRPARFVGLHFFHPLLATGLLEVVQGARIDVATVQAAMTLARRLGVTPVLVHDSPLQGLHASAATN